MMPSRVVLISLGCAALAWASADAQQLAPDRRSMTAVRLSDGERIRVDGQLDEPVWKRAQPATDFVQQDPEFGAPATERTEVRIVYDDERLVMGVTCYDSEPDRLIGYQRRRDEFLPADDRFMWTIDTYLDARSGYFFEINPSGLMADALIGAGGINNRQWDGIWTARVRRSEIGWTAEIEIPFRTLNFNPHAPAWGINFQRTVRRKNEESLWTGYARNQGLRRMTNAGLLHGIANVAQSHGLELKPYVVGLATASPNRGARAERSGDIGLDVFYTPTPRLRANFTINTDFAQTEVDQRQVNLTRFSLFFPEKRDFFLEGASFLDFYTGAFSGNDVIVNPFFSRRIGLSGAGEPQRIVFGTKLTGQAGAQDVGLLHVRTGHQGDAVSEDFTVARVKRRVLAQSYVGGILTRRDPSLQGHDRFTTGIDFRLATSTFRRSDNLELNGFVLHAPNRASDPGSLAYGVELLFPNDPWSADFGFRHVDANFDPAVGMVGRRGYRRYNPEINYAPRPRQHRWIRNFQFGARLDIQTDLAGDVLLRDLVMTPFSMALHSGDSLGVEIASIHERLDDDFDIYRGVTLRRGAVYDFSRYRFQAGTANKRMLALQTSAEFGRFYSGTRRQIELELTLRARPGAIVYTSTEWNEIDLREGRFQTRLYRLVGEAQFSPWVSLVNNFQYDSVSRVLGWQGRFRWIVRPGNDLYFVYTRNWLDDPATLRLRTLGWRSAAKAIFTHRL